MPWHCSARAASLTRWLASWGRATIALTTAADSHGSAGLMPGMMSTAELATLRTAEGTAFDRQFATMMIAHHLGAIEMARSELTAGADADARALAEQIILTQQSEVDVLRGITARL